ncbi:MAG: DsrE family protein [Deltaproteobacteria bacterium]|nr:DsrE family protein [Deltaproteobacteria bacterium]
MGRILFTGILVLTTVATLAAQPNNHLALEGLQHTGVYFDVTLGQPQKLLLRLTLIEETINGLTAAGLTPAVVIGFRGGATLFLTRGDHYLPKEDLAAKQAIQAQIRRLKQRGYQPEQCALAARLLNVKQEDIITDVPLVANGYISMIGYQSRGYAYVPMD